MPEDRPYESYSEFIEPRKLTLDCSDPRDLREQHTRSPYSRPPQEGPGMEHQTYGSPTRVNNPDFGMHNVPGPFMWEADYGSNALPPPVGLPPLAPFDEWVHFPGRHDDYGPPTIPPPFNFPPPFPRAGDLMDQHPPLHAPDSLPPLHSFAPSSPFSYDHSMDRFPNMMFDPYLPGPSNHPHPSDMQMPMLPYPPSQPQQEYTPECQTPPPDDHQSMHMSMKKPRVDKRNSKPLTVEELEHDNSRFAKVVKAFLSIEDPESRTVPEIAKRVSDMYSGQYADFEGVKRMVNDVLQKHRAFWHPGRGSPYQLNLGEGRARREFPSSRHGRSSYDDNGLYYPNKKKKSKHIHNRQLRKSVTETTNHNSAVDHSENLPEHSVTSVGQRDNGLSLLNDLHLSNPPNGLMQQPDIIIPDLGDKQRAEQQNTFEQNIDPALLSLSIPVPSDNKENTIIEPQLLVASEESRTLNSHSQDVALPR